MSQFTSTPISLMKPLWIYCENKLHRANPKFYQRSSYCRRVHKLLTVDELQKRGIKIPETLDEGTNQILMFDNESAKSLVFDRIYSLRQMLAFMDLANRCLINLTRLEDDTDFCGVLVNMIFDGLNFWDKNPQLIHKTETKLFKKHHFTPSQGQTVPQGGGYQFQVNTKKPRSYVIKPGKTSHNILNQEEFNKLADILVNANLYKTLGRLLKAFLLSPKYCEIALKSAGLKQVSNLVEKAIFYPFRLMYLEEKATYIKTVKTDRFIFTLEEANNLPAYPISINNPYFPTIWGGRTLKQQLIYPMFLNKTRGLVSPSHFNSRFNEYSFGVFSDLSPEDWDSIAVCGSIMTACAIKNPLENHYPDFKTYTKYYYPQHESGSTVVEQNSCSEEESGDLFYINSDNSDDSSADNSDGSSNADTTDKPHIQHFSDIDVMIETENMELFDAKVNELFAKFKKAVDMKYYLTLKKEQTENKYRYKITGLPRDIELFHVNSISGVISKFHLGCVRAWYDGQSVRMFPSFITSAMIGMNIDMRWVSCNKDLRDVVLKYYQRGFGIMLNGHDKQLLRLHMAASPQWKDINPPGANARYWQRRRYYNRGNGAFLHETAILMMSPASNLGIFYNKNFVATITKPRRLPIPKSIKNKNNFRNTTGAKLPKEFITM